MPHETENLLITVKKRRPSPRDLQSKLDFLRGVDGGPGSGPLSGCPHTGKCSSSNEKRHIAKTCDWQMSYRPFTGMRRPESLPQGPSAGTSAIANTVAQMWLTCEAI